MSKINYIKHAYAEGRGLACVGYEGVTSIEQYDESGSMGYVPHLRVFKGDSVFMEVPKSACIVEYLQEAQGDE